MNEKIKNSILETQNNRDALIKRYDELLREKAAVNEEVEQCKNTINFLNGKLVALNELIADEEPTTSAEATEETKA